MKIKLYTNRRQFDNMFTDWLIYIRVSTITAMDGRSQIKVHTDERTQSSQRSVFPGGHPSKY